MNQFSNKKIIHCIYIMDYSLDELPDSGTNPVVWMDIIIKEEIIGRIYIRLFRDVFPAGVENFVGLARGKTVRTEKKGQGKYTYVRQVKRTYEGSKFFNVSHQNYIVAGDIYANNGTRAGTIFSDKPIPGVFGDYFYEHNVKGLISLVPFKDEQTGELLFDSTFMITLDRPKPGNVISDLNTDQIVIGQIYQGLEVLDQINRMIFPFAGRKYPDIRIGATGVFKTSADQRRLPGF